MSINQKSAIIRPNSQRYVEATMAFIERMLTQNVYDPDIVSAFIMNALYHYSCQQIDAKLEDIQGQPCPAIAWQALARRFTYEIKQFIEHPAGGANG